MSLKDLAAKRITPRTNTNNNELRIHSEDIKKHQEQWIKAMEDLKDAKSRIESAEMEIKKIIIPKWQEFCQNHGVFVDTVVLDKIKIQIPKGSKFLNRESLDEDILRRVFGDSFERYFDVIDGPIQFSVISLNHPEIYNKIEEFIIDLAKEYPGINIIEYDSQTVPTHQLTVDYATRADKDIDSLLKAAKAERAKIKIDIR